VALVAAEKKEEAAGTNETKKEGGGTACSESTRLGLGSIVLGTSVADGTFRPSCSSPYTSVLVGARGEASLLTRTTVKLEEEASAFATAPEP